MPRSVRMSIRLSVPRLQRPGRRGILQRSPRPLTGFKEAAWRQGRTGKGGRKMTKGEERSWIIRPYTQSWIRQCSSAGAWAWTRTATATRSRGKGRAYRFSAIVGWSRVWRRPTRHNIGHFGGGLHRQSLDWYCQTKQYRKIQINKLNTNQKT